MALNENKPQLESMSLDQLWELHKKTRNILAQRLEAERRTLEDRIRQLDGEIDADKKDHIKKSRNRKPYPKVLPKFRNPTNPLQTWAGRGKQPRWLTAQIRQGKKLDDFRVSFSD